MNLRRVVVDFEFTVDDESFKAARLLDDPSGVSGVTDADVCLAVSSRLIDLDWAVRGLDPKRCRVAIRATAADGSFAAMLLPPDEGVVAE